MSEQPEPKVKKPEIHTAANPTVMRIIPELAQEIGLNESLMLLQIAFLIKVNDNYHDGQWWAFNSVRNWQLKYFPFWSVMTVNRTINKLKEAKYITVSNAYNKRKSDKTQWYALSTDELAKLKSITLVMKDVSERDSKPDAVTKRDSLYQNGTGFEQNGTTLPESLKDSLKEEEKKESIDSSSNTNSARKPAPPPVPAFPETSHETGPISAALEAHPFWQAYCDRFAFPPEAHDPGGKLLACCKRMERAGYHREHISRLVHHKIEVLKKQRYELLWVENDLPDFVAEHREMLDWHIAHAERAAWHQQQHSE